MVGVSQEAATFEGTAEGHVTLTVASRLVSCSWLLQFLFSILQSPDQEPVTSKAQFGIKAKISPTPLRPYRLLWDQFHSLRYPAGYFPRDNLLMKNDPLDWYGLCDSKYGILTFSTTGMEITFILTSKTCTSIYVTMATTWMYWDIL